ncbi:MAG TPA: chloride channel protein [Thiotrichales bacterium]|nr:chloride channel protein [Thiotrichales bacterium]
MRRRLRSSRFRLLHGASWRVRITFWVGALTVGAASALFAISGTAAENLFLAMHERFPWWPWLTLGLGLPLLAWISNRWFPAAKGSGIPQAIAVLQTHSGHSLRDSVLSLRVAVAKMVLTVGGLACGASIGREGPTVHVGAAVMYSLGRFTRFPAHYMERGLVLAGGGAGVAAAFNTPLAGIMFALEEMYRSFDRRTSSVVLTAVILAGLVAIVILGNYDYFGHSTATFDLWQDWYVIPLVAVVGGLLGGSFSELLVFSTRQIAPYARRHPVRLAFVCGLAVALLGTLSGGSVYGSGYHEARGLLEGEVAPQFVYPLMKLLTTLASYLSGIPGGIFAPSLSTGAGLGALFAQLFGAIDPSVIILLGMVAYFSGVVQTPITAFVIVMEMTSDPDMIIPMMATSLVAAGTSRLVCRTPIYEALARDFLESTGYIGHSR